jgi:hypothetical protein
MEDAFDSGRDSPFFTFRPSTNKVEKTLNFLRKKQLFQEIC